MRLKGVSTLGEIVNLGHVCYQVSDVEMLSKFCQEVMHLRLTGASSSKHAMLRCRTEHHSLFLKAAEGAPRLDHIGFVGASKSALETLAARLERNGVAVTAFKSDEEGQGDGIRFRDPDGRLLEVYTDMEQVPPSPDQNGLRPLSLTHLMITSPDMAAMRRFYGDLLGLQLSDVAREGDRDMVLWFRYNEYHHGVAIMYADSPGLHHIAWDYADIRLLKDAADNLHRHGVRLVYGLGRHGVGNNLFMYWRDPLGNMHEYLAEMQRIPPGSDHQPGVWTFESAVNRWGIMPEPEFLRVATGIAS